MELFQYQKEGVQFLKSNIRCLLADSMGLGKTCQAIVACKELGLTSILIVCPASLRLNWQNEIKKWWIEGKDYFTIVSYNFCQKDEKLETLLTSNWQLLLADEAHALKSWRSKQTKNIILKVSRKCDRVWLLTGTPATRSAADYHPLLSMIQPGMHGKFKDFCNKYCHARKGYGYPGALDYYGFKNTDDLKQKWQKVHLRRLKSEVLPQLPDKIYTTIGCAVNAEEPSDLDREEVIEGINSGVPSENLTAKLHAIGLEKVSAALNFIENCGEPLIVFAWHRDVIEGMISKTSKDCAAIHGGVSASTKQKIVEDFQAGKYEVLYLNIAAGGVGITLTKSSHILFVEPSWSPALMLQAEDRAHRIGQAAECVNIYHLIAQDSVDELVFDALRMKRAGMDAVFTKEI